MIDRISLLWLFWVSQPCRDGLAVVNHIIYLPCNPVMNFPIISSKVMVILSWFQCVFSISIPLAIQLPGRVQHSHPKYSTKSACFPLHLILLTFVLHKMYDKPSFDLAGITCSANIVLSSANILSVWILKTIMKPFAMIMYFLASSLYFSNVPSLLSLQDSTCFLNSLVESLDILFPHTSYLYVLPTCPWSRWSESLYLEEASNLPFKNIFRHYFSLNHSFINIIYNILLFRC